MLVQLEAPDPARAPELAGAIEHFRKAQRRDQEGEWRLTVEALRQALNVLAGLPPDSEDSHEDVQAAAKDARRDQNKRGYPERLELVRKALKFTCDLGAHPETDETHRADARAALLMVAGLLQWYGSTAQRVRM